LIPTAFTALRHIPELPGKLAGGVAATLAPGSGSLFAPKTRFNDAATPHRVFDARFHDLAETLVAACPMSIRSSGESGSGGNRLFGRLQALGTTIADPLERLAAIVDETSVFRDTSDSSSSTRLMELVGTVPTALMGLTVRAASAVPVAGPIIANTTVSNVPGPTDPIFFAGARLLRVTGLGPLIGGMNLFHILASYHGTVSVGVTADRSALPDPGHYADCMQSAFDEMLGAAGRSA
jgi:diacylglycerol O-acyltransferase / wax synthase